IEQKVRDRFPAGALAEVKVLRHADDPAVEPGTVLVRITANPETLPEASEHTLHGFHTVYAGEIRRVAEDVREALPDGNGRLQLIGGGEGNRFFVRAGGPGRDESRSELVPVMARLGPVDLETLDTLIGAGIAPNRAEAVRWALAKIRERPAYAALREHGRALEELKAQL
ncbi:MAG: hypothetical protein FWC87_13460, partial [Acidimicrobiaceae bacterium]|nr:hypothetical protein [Acidimicrobiaceae bacterium]